MPESEYTVSYSVFSRQWVIIGPSGRVIAHYDTERAARQAAQLEGRKSGRKTGRDVYGHARAVQG